MIYEYNAKRKVPIIRGVVGSWNDIYPETKDCTKIICSTCTYVIQDAEESINKAGKKTWSCPMCKKKSKKKYIDKQNFEEHLFKVKVEDRGDKISFYLVYFTYSISKKSNRMYCNAHSYILTYNKETKHLYLLKNKNGKYLVAPITYGAIPKWARDLYSLIHNDCFFDQKVVKGLELFKAELKRYLPTWMDNKELGLCDITTIIKEPALSYLPSIEKLGHIGLLYNLIPRTKKQLLKGQRSLKEIMTTISGHVPSKFDLSLITQKPESLIHYNLCKALFKNVNDQQALLKILATKKIENNWAYDTQYEHFFNFKKTLKQGSWMNDILCLKRLYTNETKLKNHLIKFLVNNDIFDLERRSSDINGMIMFINESLNPKSDLKKVYNSLIKKFNSIDTLHDGLVDIVNIIEVDRKQAIKYDKTTRQQFETTMLPYYKFELAESDQQIRSIGQKFGNCLGGFVKKALSNEVFIVFLRNKETEEIEYAMEISTMKELRQAEGKYNTLPPTNVCQLIERYCEEKGILSLTSLAA
ncbi:PcfJ domain-containing protein [Bacillus pumilus]|uniref:PcfJ domain-containing protein n=1 Tax=Bacillus pumilus TaxID=1408 RepID=UPI0021B48386|nr:PcfJ domain-containing protein [Bacillus pumilus]